MSTRKVVHVGPILVAMTVVAMPWIVWRMVRS